MTDEIKYAVHIVVIEDTNRAFEQLASVVASFDEADTDLPYGEAEALMGNIAAVVRRGDIEVYTDAIDADGPPDA